MKRRIIIAALLMILCGCSETDDQIEETDVIPEETVPVITEAPAPEVPLSYDYITIDMQQDPSADRIDLSDIYGVYIDNCGSASLDFLKGTSVRAVEIHGFTGAVADYDEVFSQMPKLKTLRINTLSYSSGEAEQFMIKNPSVEFSYAPDVENEDYSFNITAENIAAYAQNPVIDPYTEGSSANEFTVGFTNLTPELQRVNFMRLYFENYENNYEWEPVIFADEKDYVTVGIDLTESIEAEYYGFWDATWTMPAGLFDYRSAAPGRYKAVFTASGGEAETEFIIDNLIRISEPPMYSRAENISFLDDEQKQAFDNALWAMDNITGEYLSKSYVQSHTASDLINEYYPGLTYDYAYSLAALSGFIDESGQLHENFNHREYLSGSIGTCFVPIYIKEDEVLFRNINMCWLSGPSNVWYREYNYHMIKTDEGWKFDVFQLWY